jgi:hypothetical protein
MKQWAGACGPSPTVTSAKGPTWKTSPGSKIQAIDEEINRKDKEMSLLKILDIDVHFIRKAVSNDFTSELGHEIEAKLSCLGNLEGLPYSKSDMIRLINSIETDKMKCLKGGINGKRLYRDVGDASKLFKMEHPGFNYLKDPSLNAYFS